MSNPVVKGVRSRLVDPDSHPHWDNPTNTRVNAWLAWLVSGRHKSAFLSRMHDAAYAEAEYTRNRDAMLEAFDESQCNFDYSEPQSRFSTLTELTPEYCESALLVVPNDTLLEHAWYMFVKEGGGTVHSLVDFLPNDMTKNEAIQQFKLRIIDTYQRLNASVWTASFAMAEYRRTRAIRLLAWWWCLTTGNRSFGAFNKYYRLVVAALQIRTLVSVTRDYVQIQEHRWPDGTHLPQAPVQPQPALPPVNPPVSNRRGQLRQRDKYLQYDTFARRIWYVNTRVDPEPLLRSVFYVDIRRLRFPTTKPYVFTRVDDTKRTNDVWTNGFYVFPVGTTKSQMVDELQSPGGDLRHYYRVMYDFYRAYGGVNPAPGTFFTPHRMNVHGIYFAGENRYIIKKVVHEVA